MMFSILSNLLSQVPFISVQPKNNNKKSIKTYSFFKTKICIKSEIRNKDDISELIAGFFFLRTRKSKIKELALTISMNF